MHSVASTVSGIELLPPTREPITYQRSSGGSHIPESRTKSKEKKKEKKKERREKDRREKERKKREEREERRDWTEVRQPSHRRHQSGDSGTKVGLDPPAAHPKRLSI